MKTRFLTRILRTARAAALTCAVPGLASAAPGPATTDTHSAAPLPPHLAPPPTDNSWMTPGERRRYGWSRAGATAAIGLGLGGFALNFTSEITMDDALPSFATAGLGTPMFIAATPIAFAAGRSARRKLGVRGNKGLRTAAWVLYGAGMAQLPVLFGWGVFVDPGNTRIPDGYVVANATLLLTATSLMAADALITHRRAMEVRAWDRQRKARVSDLAIAPGPLGTHGAGLSISGRF